MRLPLLLLALALALAVPPSLARGENAGPKVCIDAGHGGKKPGAVGPRKQLEKEIALQLALKLKAELQKKLGATVILTRDNDSEVDLSDRIRKANEAGADLFISLHCNSTPIGPRHGKAKGVETFFLSAEANGEQAARVAALENAEARSGGEPGDALHSILNDLAKSEAHREASTLAYAVHDRLVKDLQAVDNGVHQAPFVVLMGAQMPAILVEAGFLSNPAESRELSSSAYQAKIARSVAEAVHGFLEEIARRGKH
jgi:N-acetylmuramoyl-L-alanine amidase